MSARVAGATALGVDTVRVASPATSSTMHAPPPWSVAAIALLAAFAAYRVWQAFAGSPILWADSADYARSAVWAGTRPPLVPIVLGLVPSAQWFVAVQVAVSVLAWSVLAVTVAARLPARPALRVVALAAVVAFASTTAVVRWDRSVLSESLAMSSLALLLAAVLWAFSGALSWPRVAVLLGAAILCAAVRDPHVWVVWALAAGVGVDAVVSARGRRGVVAAFGLALCAGVMLGGSLAADRAQANIEHVYFVRVFPYPERVDWFAAHGMPNAEAVRGYASVTVVPPAVAPVVGIDHRDQHVQPLVRWLDEHGASTYLRWLLEHPGDVAAEPFRRPERAYNFAEGDLGAYSGAGRTELGLVDAVLYPSAWVVIAVAVVAFAFASTTDLRHRAWWWMLVAFAGLGVVHMVVAWHGDGMETTRHVSVGNVQARVAVLVLAVVAGAELVHTRSARRRT